MASQTFDLRTRICTALSKRLMSPPEAKMADVEEYGEWRDASLTRSWRHFSDDELVGRDVLDFGCGAGQLSFFLADKGIAKSITGVDIDLAALECAKARLEQEGQGPTPLRFIEGDVQGLPLEAESVDLIAAFDCLEHVMDPQSILCDWSRVLRPGGRVLIEWFPFKGPWGPHMEALIPLPWAHVLFGEKAMFRTAAAIYDNPDFVPRHWDLNPDGTKKPNKWTQWESFAEQAYVNGLDIADFRKMVAYAGLEIARLERSGFGYSGVKKAIGDALMALPVLGEYATSFTVIALEKPRKP
ncbi:class I SAM-dependent methyltransferase [Erythrobacter sp. SCSIO 43205]|uniref:class I SAM-dependent methyltransferase n=1 Tax=Erythrobacter sp. SCSIO 43205 TaxID=2779361 RepID=UPI001CA92CA2|nr:class I SAM-dependent methyltransferase [Erythrobacter sp. SCSIO 43205]UAB77572.1 class I SAM-dependent methyltransferase [Erythrobacter sp. SCSIO 43205]